MVLVDELDACVTAPCGRLGPGGTDRVRDDAGDLASTPARVEGRSRPWWDGRVATALLYLIVVTVVAAVFFGVAVVVFGRGEELAPLAPDATPTRLPSRDIKGDDLRELRFPQAVRGYRMAEVDWVLDRLSDELDHLCVERDALAARVAELEALVP